MGVHLAFIGSINDQILDKEELALRLIGFLRERYPQALMKRYKSGENEGVSETEEGMLPDSLTLLEDIARIRGCLIKGSQYDLKKAADVLLDDYRSGRLGRITLEFPPDEENT